MYQNLFLRNYGAPKNALIIWVNLQFLLFLCISCRNFDFEMTKINFTMPIPFNHSDTRRAIFSACKNTLYRESCESSLFSVAGFSLRTPSELFDLSVEFALRETNSTRKLVQSLSSLSDNSRPPKSSALDDCLELLDGSMDHLLDVLHRRKRRTNEDISTWLSAALTNQWTCNESLNDLNIVKGKELMNFKVQTLGQYISNSLALHKSLERRNNQMGRANSEGNDRKLSSNGFPRWMSHEERKLMEAPIDEIKFHAVVAMDGTGTHQTIAEAVKAVSLLGVGEKRVVVHVKAGVYHEGGGIKIMKKQRNIMLIGDGRRNTIVTGNKNVQDGSSTYQSATFAATGEGFMARDMSFVNNAGPAKHQAVALLVASDRSVIYRCSIVGHQDTLYTLSNRQFYRDTSIYGTVDFIFGNSAAIFQNCYIYPRKPMRGQKNIITAQGRTDPNQSTGISIHKSRIIAFKDLSPVKHRVPTYLGRPWQKYSRTVIMQSYLDDSIHPSGWYEWSGDFALKTLFYGEYQNSGPGASTSRRVRWSGYHPRLSDVQATEFTVANFISGEKWLPSTGVPFDQGLGG